MTKTMKPRSETKSTQLNTDGAHARGSKPVAPVTSLTPPKSPVRVPELAIGILVMVVFALGAVLWHLSSVDTVPAVVSANNLERGDLITTGDLKIAYVSSDSPLTRMDKAEIDQLVGQTALVDIAPGTVMAPGLVADAQAIEPGEGVAGLALHAGQYPASGLAPGDSVNIVRSTEGADPSVESLVTQAAQVFSVEELDSGQLLVAVKTSEENADAVAEAAGAGSLRLVLVSP